MGKSRNKRTMQGPPVPRTHCARQGKVSYPTKAAARTATGVVGRLYGPQRAYKCNECGDYHLTKQLVRNG